MKTPRLKNKITLFLLNLSAATFIDGYSWTCLAKTLRACLVKLSEIRSKTWIGSLKPWLSLPTIGIHLASDKISLLCPLFGRYLMHQIGILTAEELSRRRNINTTSQCCNMVVRSPRDVTGSLIPGVSMICRPCKPFSGICNVTDLVNGMNAPLDPTNWFNTPFISSSTLPAEIVRYCSKSLNDCLIL